MANKKTKWSMDEKIRIVLQTFKPEIKVAELCREHNLAPRTPYIWKEKFLEGGKESLKSPNTGKNLKEARTESGHAQENYRRIRRGQRGFKKTLGGSRG